MATALAERRRRAPPFVRACEAGDPIRVKGLTAEVVAREAAALSEIPGGGEKLQYWGRSLCAFHGERELVYACYGIWPLWEGVGRAWTVLGPDVLALYPKALHRAVQEALEAFTARDRLVRVEAVVRSGHAAGVRWIERLGFEWEGTLRRYGPGGRGDFHIFARLRG